MMKEIESIQPVSPPPGLTNPAQQRTGPAPAGFDTMLVKAMGDVNRQYAEADRATRDLAAGRSQDVHQVMINAEKADVSFRLLMQVRNKIVAAYENIMRMGI
jgi:flagellar hook-basal body complex protein FliE